MKNTTYIFSILFLFFLGTVYSQTPVSVVKDGNYTVTGTETLTATGSITLMPNTWIRSGSTFTARIMADVYQPITLSNENYVYTRSYQEKMSSSLGISKIGDVIESVTYFDGFGRIKQQVDIRASSSTRDLVTPIVYDKFGRQDKDYLSAESPDYLELGSYWSGGDLSIQSYYKNHQSYKADFIGLVTTYANPYSQKVYDDSPLNRVDGIAAPGYDWSVEKGEHLIEYSRSTNALNEVALYTVVFTNSNILAPQLGRNGFYNANELFKNITKDENHNGGSSKNHTVEEFKDKEGRVVLNRTYNSGVAHDTYYVYDDYGNLTYVLPPKFEPTGGLPNNTELSELCYQYKYDYRNRLIEKKIPGRGWEFIIYNNLDQPILTQDQNLKAQNKWLFTKYDAFGRVAYTGIVGRNAGRAILQGEADNTALYPKQYEQRGVPMSIGGGTVSHTNVAFPKNDITELHTVNYYDTYTDSAGMVVPSSVYGEATTTNTKGLATVGKVRVLTTTNWITTISGYDKKGRMIYSKTTNPYLAATDEVKMKLDFVGKVGETTTAHTKGGQPTITTVEGFTYDHMGRPLKHVQEINNQVGELIAENTYDELGQLDRKKLGGIETGTGLQTVDYRYNIRGWLKSINDPSSLGSDLFAFGINYNTQNHGAIPLHNGNISETEWRTANTDKGLKWYTYGYDALNRLSFATDNLDRYSVGSIVDPISYDKNGNITGLKRKGHVVADPMAANSANFKVMDDLAYTYDPGNKLLKVTDAIDISHTVKGQFNDGNKAGNDYVYDGNGNMIKDLNKGIGNIAYNHFNLPIGISVATDKGAGTGTIAYIYDALGTKLKKTAPGKVTEYAGNYIYENNALAFFSQPEGYVEKTGGTYKYTYQYKDHLGNIRLTYADSDGNGSIDPSTEIITEKNYYPFGLQHRGYNNVISSNSNSAAEKFKYNGKELEESLGLNLYEMDLRQYDPAIARWTSIDPITHHSMSTYTAFDNNPVYWADPSGADAVKYVNDGSQGFIDAWNSLINESKTWKKDDDDDDWVYDPDSGEYYWSGNVTSKKSINLRSGHEYVGISQIDIGNHFNEKNNWFKTTFFDPDINTLSFRDYLSSELSSKVEIFITTKKPQRIDDIRGFYENFNLFGSSINWGRFSFDLNMNINGTKVNSGYGEVKIFENRKLNIFDRIEFDKQTYNGELRPITYPYQIQLHSSRISGSNPQPTIHLFIHRNQGAGYNAIGDAWYGN